MKKSIIESIENALRSSDHISEFKASNNGSRASQDSEGFYRKWDIQFRLSKVLCANIQIKSDFPLSWPEIYIDAEYFCKWPHVEESGKLCLFEPSSVFNQSDVEGIITCTLEYAYELLHDLITDKNTADFRDEIESYWKQCAPHKDNTRIISIVTPPFKTKIVSAYKNRDFILLADDHKQAKQWLSNYYDPTNEKEYELFKSILVDIGDKTIRPCDYPENGTGFLKLLGAFDINIDDKIRKAFVPLPSLIIICMNVETKHGDCLVASIQKKSKNKLPNGFRSVDKLPPPILNQYLFSSKLYNAKVERADAHWVHGRDKNRNEVGALSAKTVAVIGCGSIGSSVAELLLKSGVGKMHLIDGDKLSTANVSRHVLGMNSAGKNKSEELCSMFRRAYPHAEIEAHNEIWQKTKEIGKIFKSSDLILELTADKYSLQRLNAWHSKKNKRKTPIIYGYTENHAAAGFCITIGKNGGDIECALDEWGKYKLKIINWQDDDVHHEAGCGAEFVSYGAIELQYTTSLIARKAVEVLQQPDRLTSEIKCWVANKETVITAEGDWTKKWKGHPSFRDEGFIMFSEKLPKCA